VLIQIAHDVTSGEVLRTGERGPALVVNEQDESRFGGIAAAAAATRVRSSSLLPDPSCRLSARAALRCADRCSAPVGADSKGRAEISVPVCPPPFEVLGTGWKQVEKIKKPDRFGMSPAPRSSLMSRTGASRRAVRSPARAPRPPR